MPYDEFRVQITPNINGQLSLQILESPIAGSAGPKGQPDAEFAAADLAAIRDKTKFAHGGNLAEMQRIGQAVYRSVTNPAVQAALDAAIQVSSASNRSLRIVFSTLSIDGPLPGVRPSEIPFETIYAPMAGFYASAMQTPVSRTLVAKPDRPTVPLAPPLRILLIAASPQGWPPADIAKETATIKEALKDLESNRLVTVDPCIPPTRAELNRRLLSGGYHVVHFAGHGGVGQIGGDPTPRAFLCLQAEDDGLDPLDAFTFDSMLKNCPTVTLVVITGCSTAALPPPIAGAPYAATAFDGIAQRLVSPGSLSYVSAVVAMQFDLESAAAVSFSGKFYGTLLNPGATIDEAVTAARSQIAATTLIGTPDWANPVLYWRCKDGRPFDVRTYHGETLPPDDEKKVMALKIQVEAYRASLQDLMAQPPAVQVAAAPFRQSIAAKIDGFLSQISDIMGNSIRLKGGRPDAEDRIDFSLTARLRGSARIDEVRVKISFEEEAFDFVSATKGAQVPKAPLSGAIDGMLEVLVENVSAGAVLAPGEYEIAKIRMKVKDRSQSTRVLTIIGLELKASPDVFYSSVDGYAFLSLEQAAAG
ncbi:CHAT domain-containing protein [Bradyrhizobium sp. SZCCHNS2005]|uniref:CHAT domain-containing protein n=1 Tax=Bradyrhizobium sp. SZCCHNS2005 TaxID=3057303 RepID=UPI0028F10874|nr:CHAT domain-containing protein [Bradyrhizobium sp. SZCCHNS2005]